MAVSSPPVFSSIVLPISGLPFLSRQQFSAPARERDLWLGGGAAVLLLALLMWCALSGFNQVSHEWWQRHPSFALYSAATLWVGWLVVGFKSFNKFLA